MLLAGCVSSTLEAISRVFVGNNLSFKQSANEVRFMVQISIERVEVVWRVIENE